MKKYLFYPGCSMESSAKAYMETRNTILEPLDLHFEEIEDWNCCGATEYLGTNLIHAYSLIARNLALALFSVSLCERRIRNVRDRIHDVSMKQIHQSLCLADEGHLGEA